MRREGVLALGRGLERCHCLRPVLALLVALQAGRCSATGVLLGPSCLPAGPPACLSFDRCCPPGLPSRPALPHRHHPHRGELRRCGGAAPLPGGHTLMPLRVHACRTQTVSHCMSCRPLPFLTHPLSTCPFTGWQRGAGCQGRLHPHHQRRRWPRPAPHPGGLGAIGCCCCCASGPMVSAVSGLRYAGQSGARCKRQLQ